MDKILFLNYKLKSETNFTLLDNCFTSLTVVYKKHYVVNVADCNNSLKTKPEIFIYQLTNFEAGELLQVY